jgi:alpha-beta hydrolase superfamily lysophospholipase
MTANSATTLRTPEWRRSVLHNIRWTYHSSPRNRGNLVLIHGYRDGQGSVDGWASDYCNSGFNVATCDLPGHGESANGKPGYFASMQELTDAVSALITMVWEQERVPTFVVGFSLGAFIELLLLTQQRALREGLIKGVVSVSAPLDVRGTARVYFPGSGLLLSAASCLCGEWQVPNCFVNREQRLAVWEPTAGGWCYRGRTFFRVAHLFFKHTRQLRRDIRLLDAVPICAFQGTEDTTAGYKTAKKVFGSLSNTVFHSVPGMPHYLLGDSILSYQILNQSAEWLCNLATHG